MNKSMVELTDKRLGNGHLFCRSFVEQLLRDAWNDGYHRGMESGKSNWDNPRVKSMETEVEQLSKREREAELQFRVAKANLDSIRRQIDQLIRMIDLARQGQLDLDIRPDPGL